MNHQDIADGNASRQQQVQREGDHLGLAAKGRQQRDPLDSLGWLCLFHHHISFSILCFAIISLVVADW
jgi:hypothetical protein